MGLILELRVEKKSGIVALNVALKPFKLTLPAYKLLDLKYGPCWARTSDPLIKSQLLYQLS